MVRSKPVSDWMAVIFAADTTAPLASTTVPRILAEISCAGVLPAHTIAKIAKQINLPRPFMRFSLLPQ